MFKRTTMDKFSIGMRWALPGGLLFSLMAALLTGGCATTKPTETHQFDPAPRANVKTDDLDPVNNRPVVELLREAAKAFEDGNKAEEAGDHKKSVECYALMLKRMTEADMDPSVFYSMRKEFGKILNSTNHHSKTHPNQLDSAAGEKGDLRVPFPLPEPVLAEIEFWQHTIPGKFQTFLNRSPRYMPYMRREFEKAGLPPDVAWLALIESGFSTSATSPAGAGGMWQFMRPTATRYGLQQDTYVDERNDWKSATRAAIEYLKYLRDEFDGDWALALSAYNMGEGGLQRSIDANGGDHDFWSLIQTPPASDRIRLETKRYYPLFLAAMIIANSPERYGFTITPQPEESTAEVRVKGMYALSDLDKAMGYSSGTLSKLNPELIKEVTPPNREFRVAVPAADEEKFAAAIKDMPQVEIYAKYQVRKGDTLAKVAQQYGMDPRDLAQCNKLRPGSSIRKGQVLRVPNAPEGRGGSTETKDADDDKKDAPSEESKLATSGDTNGYTVRPGDTLNEIAKSNGLELRQLKEWNQIDEAAVIRPGDRLHISDPAQPAKKDTAAEAASGQSYSVQSGDTLNKIALKYKVSVDNLRAWNGLSGDTLLHVGDSLRLAAKGKAAPTASPAPAAAKTAKTAPTIKHIVAKGDTASTIASKYGVKVSDVLTWNSLTPASVLKLGQVCVIHPSEKSAAPEVVAKEVKEAPAERTQLAEAKDPAPKAAKAAEPIVHVVSKGNNPSGIARQYGVRVSDLFKWNNWPQTPVLKVGDEVKVFKK